MPILPPFPAAVLLLAGFGALALACGDTGSSTAVARTQIASAESATPAPPAEWQTPIMLPVTPGPLPAYTIVDPAFEPLPGARAFAGVDESMPAAHAYQIEVPDDWNGDVVFFAHGFRGNGGELTVGPPPIRDYLVYNGYAWAASSYSQNGYRPGVGAADTARLLPIFEQLVGEPDEVFLYGQSMGGNVVTVSLESPELRSVYDGAVSECGAMTASAIVDYFLSWGALAGYLTNTELTNVATDAGEFVITLRDVVTPALGSPDNPTPDGQTFANAIQHLTGGPRPFFHEGFKAQYSNNFAVLFGAIVAPAPSNAVAQNADTVYEVDGGLAATTDEINNGIARVEANPQFRNPSLYPEFAPATGDIEVPLLTLHGTGDLFVPIHLEQRYRQLAESAGKGDLLVQRAIARAGHCMFTAEERIEAFADLVAWVETGTEPAGDDLLGDLTRVGFDFIRESN